MSVSNKVDQFIKDSDVAHRIIHGDADEVVETEGGPVPSFAKAIGGMTDFKERLVAVETSQGSGVVGRATLAELIADLSPVAGTLIRVTNDSNASNNGTWRKLGAPGTGSWVQAADDVSELRQLVPLKADRVDLVSVNERLQDPWDTGMAQASTADFIPLVGGVDPEGNHWALLWYRKSDGAVVVGGQTLQSSALLGDRLAGMAAADGLSVIPLAAIADEQGNHFATTWYDPQLRQLLVNGSAMQSAEDLGVALAGMVAADADVIVLAATRDGQGQCNANVWYDPKTGQLKKNGTPIGEVHLVYAPARALQAQQIPAQAEVMHLVTYGQSLSKGFNSLPPYSIQQPYKNLTFRQGPKSTRQGSVGSLPGMDSLVPLVENSLNGDGVDAPLTGETPCSAWANGTTRRQALGGQDWRTSGRAFLATANGKGSASIVQLLPGGSTDMGEWWQVMADAIEQGHALASAAGKSYVLPAWLYLQGEGDNANQGNAGGVYLSRLIELRTAVTAKYQAVTGSTYTPWVGVYQTYGRSRRDRPHATLDQLEFAESQPNAFHLTALYHLSLAADGHLTALGSFWVGEYAAKRTAQLLAGVSPQWLRSGTATVRGRLVRYAPREIPVAPLRLHIDQHLRPVQDMGFQVRDEQGVIALQSTQIGPRGDDVLLTLARDPVGELQLRYALDYLPEGQLDYGGSAGGNLVDSDPETFTFNASEYPLYNVSPHFQIPVIPL